MAVSTPDWLRQHEGEFREAADGLSGTVHFAGQLQYLLVAVPAKGQFACRITESVNGRRLDGDAVYPSNADALRGGLDVLRSRLGW